MSSGKLGLCRWVGRGRFWRFRNRKVYIVSLLEDDMGGKQAELESIVDISNFINEHNRVVEDVSQRPGDHDPFRDVENIENAISIANQGMAAYAASVKAGTDFIAGLMKPFLEGNSAAENIISHQQKFADDLYTTASEVAKPVNHDVPMSFEMTRVNGDDRDNLMRCKLPGRKYRYKDNDGKPPVFISLPIMRDPNLVGSNPGLVQTFLKHDFDVYVPDHKSPEPNGPRIHDNIRDYLDTGHFLVEEITERTKQRPYGVHICQFGYMALLMLGERPNSMFPNVLAGVPVDMSEGILPEFARSFDIEKDVKPVLRAKGWVMDGDDMIRFWKYFRDEDREAAQNKFFAIYNKVKAGKYDPKKAEKFENFLNSGTRNIPGDLELNLLNIFANNLLMKPGSIYGIDMKKYTNYLSTITGGKDWISEEKSCLGAYEVAGTPKSRQAKFHNKKRGHSGIYISDLSEYWEGKIIPWMKKVRPDAERIAARKPQHGHLGVMSYEKQ